MGDRCLKVFQPKIKISSSSGLKRKPEGSPQQSVASQPQHLSHHLHSLKKSKSDVQMAPELALDTAADKNGKIREKETIRLILQALSEMGYSKSVEELEKESGTYIIRCD